MSKKVLLPAFIVVAVFAAVLLRGLAERSGEFVGPVIVPLHVGAEDLSLRGLHATDDTVVVVEGIKGSLDFHWTLVCIGSFLSYQMPLRANSAPFGLTTTIPSWP